jgi:hypothetical protein
LFLWLFVLTLHDYIAAEAAPTSRSTVVAHCRTCRSAFMRDIIIGFIAAEAAPAI